MNKQTFDINENDANGMIAGVVLASDLDGNILIFNIINAFVIVSQSGEIKVNNSTVLETVSIFNLTVSVSDGLVQKQAKILINIKTEIITFGKTNDFKVYPNSALDCVFLETNDNFETLYKYILFNSIGMKIYKKLINNKITKISLPVGTGFYFIRIIDKKKIIDIKIK